MSVKAIRLFGDPVLRTTAEPVRDFDAELRKLVKDLTDTMMDAPGAGLAAPQIGVGLRVFTYFVDDELGHLINPSLDLSEEEDTDEEGCLSFPGLAFPTKRAWGTVAKGFNIGSSMLERSPGMTSWAEIGAMVEDGPRNPHRRAAKLPRGR